MKNIIALCIRRPISVIMLMAAMFMGAAYSIRVLPLDRLPEIIFPRITVETSYPGMGAAEVRTAVSVPLEDSLSALKGLEGIRSVSRDGSSLLILSFRWGTAPVRAAALVREAIDTVYPGLPYGVSKPALVSGDSSDGPHAIIAVRSLAGDNNFARNLAEYELRARMRSIDGAGRVSVSGGERQEIRIRADPARLSSRSLNGGDLAGLVAYETGDFPAGSAMEGSKELTVVSSGRPRSPEELSGLVISPGSGPLMISDLAETARENTARQSLFICDDIDQAAIEVFRRPGADPVRLSKDIGKVLDECNALFSDYVQIRVVYDSSPSIIRGIGDLGISGGLASLAVILLLAIFLGRLSCSILAVLSLPVSASAAMIALAAAGKSLNSMSLAGLALGIGLVSDTSVVVLDLFCRKLGSAGRLPSPASAGALAASVSLSSMAGAATTMIVFLPVIFLPGPLGALFGDLALSLIVSVAAGWAYAQFCLPSLFCFLFVRGVKLKVPKPGMFSRRIAQNAERTYARLLKNILRRPVSIIMVSALAIILGLALLYTRPAEFFAPEAVSEIEVALDFPPGTTPDGAVRTGIAASGALSGLGGISGFYGIMGAEEDDHGRRSDPDYRRERLLFRCFLENGNEAELMTEKIRAALGNMGMPISIGFPASRTAAILGLSPALTLAVKGGTPEECLSGGDALAEWFRRNAGGDLESMRLRPSGTRPQLRLVPRRELCAAVGISASEIASALYAALEGIVTGSMEIEGRSLDVRVSLDTGNNDPHSLAMLPIALPASPNGRSQPPVFLGSLADIEWVEAETALFRQERSDLVYLDLFPAAGSQKKIESLAAGNGWSKMEGEPGTAFSRADGSVFSRYRTALISTVALVLCLLYLILGAQFESFLLPLILLLSVPFSLAGAGPALFFGSSSLDSGAVLGLVVLFGISVNNGIVIYEISEEKIRSGSSPVKAVFIGALERFRPVLLTTLTTVFGLLPLVASPMGNSQRSMASAMLGGIIVSGLLAFFAFPPVFIRYFSKKGRCRL